MQKIDDFGIGNYIQGNNITEGLIGRVIERNHHMFDVATAEQLMSSVQLVSRLYDADVVVGDFVSIIKIDEHIFINEIYPRTTIISKQFSEASKSMKVNQNEQSLAANVDQLFILIAADQRFTLGKFERYMMAFNREEIDINILVSKADYTDKTLEIITDISMTYPDITITPISIYHPHTIEEVKSRILQGKTAMFIGASGAGKSTLINMLNSNELITNEVRSDGKGKHTTTVTTMIYMKETDSYLIDSPGFKTISTTNEMDFEVLYEPIFRLKNNCKFNDCTHTHEPGCAVKLAVDEGEINESLYERYLINEKKIIGELKHEANKEKKKERNLKKKK